MGVPFPRILVLLPLRDLMPRVPEELAVLLTLLWLAWLFRRMTSLLGVGYL